MHDTTGIDTNAEGARTTLFGRMGGRAGLMRLLRQFYADVRQHREIGPIFMAQIENWPAHLEKIGDFWMGATGGPLRYAGPMPQRHFPLGIGETHFAAWLDLWRRNCRIHLPADAADEMIALSEAIGDRLRFLIARDRAIPAAADGVSPPSAFL
jgi:hemoglobin